MRVSCFAFLFALCLNACVAQTPTATTTFAQIIQQSRRSTVVIKAHEVGAKTFDLVGTGWLYDSQDTIVTAAHVVTEDDEDIKVDAYQIVFQDGTSCMVDKVYKSTTEDVAVLDLKDSELGQTKRPLFHMAMRAALFGEEVYTVGHPYGLEYQLSTGRVTNDTYDLSGNFVTSAVFLPGNSGGAVCDTKGGVVGLVLARSGQSETLNFALKYDALKKELSALIKQKKAVK